MWHLPLRPPHLRAFTYYDREVLPYKNDDAINAHAMPGAHDALQAVQDAGLRCALFTNPAFPKGPSSAAWAGAS